MYENERKIVYYAVPADVMTIRSQRFEAETRSQTRRRDVVVDENVRGVIQLRTNIE